MGSGSFRLDQTPLRAVKPSLPQRVAFAASASYGRLPGNLTLHGVSSARPRQVVQSRLSCVVTFLETPSSRTATKKELMLAGGAGTVASRHL